VREGQFFADNLWTTPKGVTRRDFSASFY